MGHMDQVKIVKKGQNLKAAALVVDNSKMKPIVLYGWEGASACKPVRAKLNELGLAHTFITCASGSQNRRSLESKTKTFQVPYIEDPNTNVKMFESKEIVAYLQQVYTTT